MPTDSAPKYKKVLLKVSGEVLMGDQGYGIDMATVDTVAAAIARVADGVVVGSAIVEIVAAHGADAPGPVTTYVRSLADAVASARKVVAA